MHFRHISAKIQPKNQKLVHYLFLAVQGNIRLGGGPALWTPSFGYAFGPLFGNSTRQETINR